jgi:hypothetical protein
LVIENRVPGKAVTAYGTIQGKIPWEKGGNRSSPYAA